MGCITSRRSWQQRIFIVDPVLSSCLTCPPLAQLGPPEGWDAAGLGQQQKTRNKQQQQRGLTNQQQMSQLPMAFSAPVLPVLAGGVPLMRGRYCTADAAAAAAVGPAGASPGRGGSGRAGSSSSSSSSSACR